MSGPPQALGPPPFEPSIETISSLSASIQTSLVQYETAKTPEEKATALKAIQTTSTKLARVTAPIQHQFMELNHRPYVNVVVRLALELGFFEALPESGEPITVAETAKKITASEEFILRLVRVLCGFEILEAFYSPSSVLSYSHSPLSRFLTSPAAKASFRNHFEILLPGQLSSVPGYYHKYGFKSPEDSKNAPFTFAHGIEDADFFDIIHRDPEKLAFFNDAMTIMAVLGLRSLGSLYAFDKLVPNTDGVALVDIGGGKGQMLQVITEAYPTLKGKLVLEDLKVVLDGGVVVAGDEAALQPYDFFKEVQPIKGSNYFLKSVFHDWPDKACIQILNNLVPAMEGSPHSKLLICELVLSDQYPEPVKAVRDINMLVVGGKERSLGQWHDLLGQAGFKILKVYGMGEDNSSIIEAVLNN